MMLKDYAKVLYDIHRNGKPFCWVGAAVCDGEFHLKRIDYEEWEYNRRTGEVEINIYIDAANTQKLCNALKVNTSAKLVAAIKKEMCIGSSGCALTSNLIHFCEEHGIEHDYQTWY